MEDFHDLHSLLLSNYINIIPLVCNIVDEIKDNIIKSSITTALNLYQGQMINCGLLMNCKNDNASFDDFAKKFESFSLKNFQFDYKFNLSSEEKIEVNQYQVFDPNMNCSEIFIQRIKIQEDLNEDNTIVEYLYIYSTLSLKLPSKILGKKLWLDVSLSLHNSVNNSNHESIKSASLQHIFEEYRYKSQDIPTLNRKLEVKISDHASIITKSIQQLSSSSCIWNIIVYNMHPYRDLIIHDIEIHMKLSQKVADIKSKMSNDNTSSYLDDNFQSRDQSLSKSHSYVLQSWQLTLLNKDILSSSKPLKISVGESYSLAYIIQSSRNESGNGFDADFDTNFPSGSFITPFSLVWSSCRHQTTNSRLSSELIESKVLNKKSHLTSVTSYHLQWSIGTIINTVNDANYSSVVPTSSESKDISNSIVILPDIKCKLISPLVVYLHQPFVISFHILNNSLKQVYKLLLFQKSNRTPVYIVQEHHQSFW